MPVEKVSAEEILGTKGSIIAPGSANPALVKWHRQRREAEAKAAKMKPKPDVPGIFFLHDGGIRPHPLVGSIQRAQDRKSRSKRHPSSQLQDQSLHRRDGAASDK